MPNGDPKGGFFYPTLTLMMDSYNLLYIVSNISCTDGKPCSNHSIPFTSVSTSMHFKRYFVPYIMTLTCNNNADPDEIPPKVAFKLGLHFLSINLFFRYLERKRLNS